MSVRKDCEMLSIETMEAYAKKYSISGDEAARLFHEKQVFEKILIQYEYLHQVSQQEALEFVEKVIKEESRDLIVYHGSCYDFEKIDLNMSHNRRDFGKGFYVTPIEEQAVSWVSRFKRLGKPGIVNVYEFDFEKVKQDLRILIFEEYNTEWLDFIIKCRNGELIYQDYDVIAGGIADDKVFNTVELYLDQLISKEEALGRLKYYKPNFQICIVNQEVIYSYLTYKESRDV